MDSKFAKETLARLQAGVKAKAIKFKDEESIMQVARLAEQSQSLEVLQILAVEVQTQDGVTIEHMRNLSELALMFHKHERFEEANKMWVELLGISDFELKRQGYRREMAGSRRGSSRNASAGPSNP